MVSSSTSCGYSWCGYPNFLQRFATTRSFILVWGLLGTFQAMGYVYFIITLQTVEKRFKIPSQTTGLILSGNEVSQILLSVVLAYFGGQRNRPRFITWGVIFCSLSCFILALPHFMYGPGEDALRLTKEYMESSNSSILDNTAVEKLFKQSNRLCSDETTEQDTNDMIESIVPLVLIFLSQFVLGVGNTLYYALGQTYLDDNTKKTNTPLLLSYAFALRTFGPAIGFVLGYLSLKIYIDPTKTPLIDSQDPRWMGCWWAGHIFLGIALILVSFLVGLFPKQLPKKRNETLRPISDNVPRILTSSNDVFAEESRPLKADLADTQQFGGSMLEIPTFKQFPAALARLFKNKLLMCNICSGIFYILGASGYFTFMSKYLEVQFHKSAADATIITGPFTIIGVVVGFLASGYIISKKKPSPSKLLMWNVIVGVMFMFGQVSYLFLTCPDGETPMLIQNNKLNLTSTCNSDCHCSGIPYTPVCLEESGDTFFSPCHAGCLMYSKADKYYSECQCVNRVKTSTTKRISSTSLVTEYISIATTNEPTVLIRSSPSIISTVNVTEFLPTIPPSLVPPQLQKDKINDEDQISDTKVYDVLNEVRYDDDIVDEDETEYNEESEKESKERVRRSNSDEFLEKLKPGACVKGCLAGFFAFSVISCIINCFGASGRIGNVLVNYRCVSNQDKSVTQGLILMLISLFALIPGPILYGRIIDSTCLVWTEQSSGRRGNCQLYDQRLFRYYINLSALALTAIGVFFDVLVWKFGKKLDLYGEREELMLQQKKSFSRNVKS